MRSDDTEKLLAEVERRAPIDAVKLLDRQPDADIAELLTRLNPSTAVKILWRFPESRRQGILSKTSAEREAQWTRNHSYPEGTVGRLMEPAVAVFGLDTTAQEAIARLRELVKRAFITYGYVTDEDGILRGILVMRDLMLAEPGQRLRGIMVRDPFFLTPETDVTDAMRQVLHRHYPVYPICDANGRLLGIVRGYDLFEEATIELTAQTGRMVGVEKEERLATPWWRSLKFRHPWLQLNLLTAFLAAAVVGFFQDTIDQLVILAAFLPVLAGQSGNTGCQALAVTLRGMTLGDLKTGTEKQLVGKEALLGLLNGVLVGLTAGLAMYFYATRQHNPAALTLGIVVCVAMIGSCVISGVSGALVPMGLKKLGADPATASSIFLTTATDVASMGLLLGLATWLIL